MNQEIINAGFEIEFLGPDSRNMIRADLYEKFGYKFVDPNGFRDHWNLWHLKNDRSIHKTSKHDNEFVGHELISPVRPYEETMKELKKVFDWLIEKGFRTNKSCGLHMSFSFQNTNLIKKVNKLKLVILTDEFGVLKEFNRENNNYCIPHRLALVKNCHVYSGKSPIDFSESQLNKIIDLEKYRTINFKKLHNGYIEYRPLGGTNYHKKQQAIFRRLEEFKNAFELSIDPDAGIKEYEAKSVEWLTHISKNPEIPYFKMPDTANPVPNLQRNQFVIDLNEVAEHEIQYNWARRGIVYESWPINNATTYRTLSNNHLERHNIRDRNIQRERDRAIIIDTDAQNAGYGKYKQPNSKTLASISMWNQEMSTESRNYITELLYEKASKTKDTLAALKPTKVNSYINLTLPTITRDINNEITETYFDDFDLEGVIEDVG